MSATFTVTVPVGTPDGLYQGDFIFYEDEWLPAGNAYNVGTEPFYLMPVRINVTTPFVSAVPALIALTSDPGLQTGSATLTISNPTLLALTHLRYEISDLVNGPFSIASTAVTFVPETLPNLVGGASVMASLSVSLASPTQPPGLYTGTFMVYEDRNSNNNSPASQPVWFDGVQLEKAVFPQQTRPTCYDPAKKLISPGSGQDIGGRKKYYEW